MRQQDSRMEPKKYSPWKVWENPIFRRYCKSRLRVRGLSISLLVTVLIASFILAIANSFGLRMQADAMDIARPAIIGLIGLQWFIMYLVGTAQVAGGITAERDEGVIDYQRLIPMSPLSKVVGYMFGLPVREYVMFLSTLPFTCWALWKGQVGWETWVPLYGVFFTTTLLYHFTGLLAGTVVRNRRWAFLITIGLVISLYTVIPQMAKFGLVFFKYLTIIPVFQECMAQLLPETIGAVVETGQRLAPTVKFFNLNFSESVFTVFTQGGLILTFCVMLCRRWRWAESHLMGKLWAVGFFVWIQILLLGNALPLIDPGNLFPSRGFSQFARIDFNWKPDPNEAVFMSGLYGLVSLALMFILMSIITPTRDRQLQGWRRARKMGESRIPRLSEAASSFWFVAAMAVTGAVGWFLFSRGLVESRWFPGQELSMDVLVYFALITVACGLGTQALLEAKGGRVMGLVGILAGVVPLMAGLVIGVVSNQLVPPAVWLLGISPLSVPFLASGSLLEIAELPAESIRAVPRAFHFWLLVSVLVSGWLVVRLRAFHREMAKVDAPEEME